MTNALAQVASAQAQASQAEARLAAEEAEANAAREEWRLLKKDGDPPALLLREPQIHEARTAIIAARALEESASAGIESGQASLLAAVAAKERAQLDLERCIIRAPFDARVVHGTVDLASTVSSQHSRRVATDRFCGSEITVITSAINTTRCRFRGQKIPRASFYWRPRMDGAIRSFTRRGGCGHAHSKRHCACRQSV